jgi:hypothetical protein
MKSIVVAFAASGNPSCFARRNPICQRGRSVGDGNFSGGDFLPGSILNFSSRHYPDAKSKGIKEDESRSCGSRVGMGPRSRALHFGFDEINFESSSSVKMAPTVLATAIVGEGGCLQVARGVW